MSSPYPTEHTNSFKALIKIILRFFQKGIKNDASFVTHHHKKIIKGEKQCIH